MSAGPCGRGGPAARAIATPPPELLGDVLAGLRGTPKTLPAKLFYDERGAELFEEITRLDEYYLTRSELEILEAHAADIARLAGPECALIEYGSGAGVKVRLLLDALERPAAYVPIDISSEQLADVAVELADDYPAVEIRPVAADYTRPIQLPALHSTARRLAFFPGSTIGNFHPAEASAFLARVRRVVGSSGALVLGVDRHKSADVLNAAYDDCSGVTAEFNMNMLRRINGELAGNFDLTAFRHRAFFNEDASRVEMHLESLERQCVTVAGARIPFEEGETIWTESSYKYDEDMLTTVVAAAGFRVEQLWTDGKDRFWVAYLSAV
jgi:L-histidine N-alpha-methyltransferase